MVMKCMDASDFKEGVRALLVDKDGSPMWAPSQLCDVQNSEIDKYFANRGSDELTF